MKTSNWIRFIGILCIVFGLSGIFDIILPILISSISGKAGEMIKSPQDNSTWFMITGYLGFFVKSFYLVAGIFFLLKKPYSIWIMYCALTINILYVLIPMLIVKLYHSIIFILPGLFIDLALLISVYRIRKFYLESPDEIVKVFGDYSPKPRLLKIIAFIGFTCFSISLSILGLWIHSFNIGKAQDDAVVIFKSYFPDFLQRGDNISYLSLFLCFLAIVFTSLGLKSQGFLWKMNMIILVLSSCLLFLNLFQLM
jgi:hypothetical protein